MDVSAENLSWRQTAPRGDILSYSVFHTLAYADVFDYPLTAPEVYRYLSFTKATFQEVTRALSDKLFFSRAGEYFTLRGRESIVETRIRRAQFAAGLWNKSARYGQMIVALPFVRMVAVTGSLAMNNTEQGNDVDYMIVTAPNHLWTCRALILLIARLAKREGIRLCPNYLVTTNALALKEQSLYVAHELAQMIPLSGLEIYDEIRRRNDWIENYLPQASGAPQLPQAPRPVKRPSGIQRGLEILFSLPFGDWLEKWEMNRKIGRLTREQSRSFESYFSADVCKGHVDRHGENVATQLVVRLGKMTDPRTVASTETV